MTQRTGTAVYVPRPPSDLGGAAPAEAYLKDADGADVFTFGAGRKAGEATAFLKDVGGGLLVLDDDEANESRMLSLADGNTVVIGDADPLLLFLYTPRAPFADMAATFARASTAFYEGDISVTEFHYTPGAGHLAEYFTRASTAFYESA